MHNLMAIALLLFAVWNDREGDEDRAIACFIAAAIYGCTSDILKRMTKEPTP